MPFLSIIPAAAVADPEVKDAHLRVLCAIGTFTSKLGGEMWASVRTLSKACDLSERTVQRALPILISRGYLRAKERPGRTTIYEVRLDGVTPVTPGGDSSVTPPPTDVSPERYQERSTLTVRRIPNTEAINLAGELVRLFPARDEPAPFPAVIKAVGACLREGVDAQDLVTAAEGYADHVERQQVEPRYRKSLVRFLTDGVWQQYREREVRVHGLTRAQWIRSGQDVQIFDTTATGGAGDPQGV